METDDSSKAVTYGSGGVEPESIAIADVNGDGKPDLVAANVYSTASPTSGSIGVLLGNGDGTFQPAISFNSGAVNAVSVKVADVNGDGIPDLVVANQCSDSSCASGTVSVLLGKGKGAFQPAVNYGSGGQYASSVAVADVNHDGKPDLIVTNWCVSYWRLHERYGKCAVRKRKRNVSAGCNLRNGRAVFLAGPGY